MDTRKIKQNLKELLQEIKTEFSVEMTTDESFALGKLAEKQEATRVYREYLETKTKQKKLVHFSNLAPIPEEAEESTISLRK